VIEKIFYFFPIISLREKKSMCGVKEGERMWKERVFSCVVIYIELQSLDEDYMHP
jgi:hypothetical protein